MVMAPSNSMTAATPISTWRCRGPDISGSSGERDIDDLFLSLQVRGRGLAGCDQLVARKPASFIRSRWRFSSFSTHFA